LFGDIAESVLVPSVAGEIVAEEWWRTGELRPGIELDAFVLMPNHLHGIVAIRDRSASEQRALGLTSKDAIGALSAVVRGFKGATTRRVRDELGGDGTSFWQRSFYDHIIRNERDLDRIRAYIANNPANWTTDAEYRPRGRDR
jgi:REP element-mobilizing transposase RayT